MICRVCGCSPGSSSCRSRFTKATAARLAYTTSDASLSVFANAITSFSNRPLVYIFYRDGGHGAVASLAAAVLLYTSSSSADRRTRLGVDHRVDLVSRRPDHLLRRRDRHVPGEVFIEIKQRPYTIVRAEYMSRAGSAAVSSDMLRGQARDYYETKLRTHGPTPAGVDWNSARVAGAALRAARTPVARRHRRPVDPRLRLRLRRARRLPAGAGHRGAYVGFDVSEAMIEAARAHAASLPACRVHRRSSATGAGRLRGRQRRLQRQAGRTPMTRGATTSGDRGRLAALGTRGFAFNVLTAYSDADKRRRGSLLRRPAASSFDRCKRRYSPASRCCTTTRSTSSRSSCDVDIGMAQLVIFGAGDIARLAHHYFSTDPAARGRRLRRRCRRSGRERHVPRAAAGADDEVRAAVIRRPVPDVRGAQLREDERACARRSTQQMKAARLRAGQLRQHPLHAT